MSDGHFRHLDFFRLVRGEHGDVYCLSYLAWYDPYYCSATAPTSNLPVIHDDTPLIHINTPTISPIVPTIPSIAPTIQYTSPFICTDSSNSDTPDTPPSPIHDTQPAEITPSISQILPAPPELPRRPTIIVLPGQSILVGRPYRTQPNGVLKMLIAKKHSSSGHSISYSSCVSPIATYAGLFRKRRRSPNTSVPIASPVPGVLSPVRADLLPPCKRIRNFDSMIDFEVTDIKKDKIQAKPDKTKNEMESVEKSKVNPVKVKDGAEVEELLNGPTRTHLMGGVS
nr:hypothetical protein [Tanacetum cinerariifolium]